MKITMEWLKENKACVEGVAWFVGQDKRDAIDVLEALILDASQEKLGWANWLICRVLDRTSLVRYAIFAAEQVVDIFDKEYPNDDRPRKAIESAKEVLKNPTIENKKLASAVYASAYAATASAYAASASASAYAVDAEAFEQFGQSASAAHAAAYAATSATSAAYAATAYASAAHASAYASAYAAHASAYASAYAATSAAYASAAYAGGDMLIKIIRHGILLFAEEKNREEKR